MKISVIGCGWLGLPLAAALAESGHKVLGSTTQESKFESLISKGIKPVLFKLDPMPTGKAFNALFKADLLIINIPPGRRKNTPEHYEEQIKYLKYLLGESVVFKVIFISSTSYYPNAGELVDTKTSFNFEKGSSRAVVKGEGQISEISQDLVILRCGGLMGMDRIPGKWFAGKPTSGADTPVNYIHQKDIIKIIQEMVVNWPSKNKREIFNLVSPDHPKRKEVHEMMAKKYGFEPPVWIDPSITSSKIVKSSFEDRALRSPMDF